LIVIEWTWQIHSMAFQVFVLRAFVNTEIWVEPRPCHKICESKIYLEVPFCLDVCCIIRMNRMEHL
jgi:hypothetical protein